MKRFKTLVILLLLGICAGLGYRAVEIETYALIWERRVNSVESIEATNLQVLKSQEYSNRCLEAVNMLAVENGLKSDRELKMIAYVQTLEEENTRLKFALKESVERLEKQVEEINELMKDNEQLSWQVGVLERALKAAGGDAPKMQTKPDFVDDFFDYIELADRVLTVITIIPLL